MLRVIESKGWVVTMPGAVPQSGNPAVETVPVFTNDTVDSYDGLSAPKSWNLALAMSKYKQKGKKLPKAEPAVPPSISLVPVIPAVFRYLKTNAAQSIVAATDFGKMCLLATSSTQAAAIYEAVRVTKICAWSPPSTMTSATGFAIPSVKLTQMAGWVLGFGSEKVSQGYATGLRGGYAKLKLPPPNDDWVEPIGTAGQNIFKIEGPIGCVVDVHIVFRLYAKSQTQTLYTSSGATAGKMYYNYLDSATGYLQCQNGENNTNVWV